MKHFIQTVVHGKKLGRTIGFPTANMKLEKDFIQDGTYKINIVYQQTVYAGVGVARNILSLFEAHIFDFEKTIYGEKLEIIILEKIRDNKKFASLEALQQAIQHDVQVAKSRKHIGMVFGSFDLVHEGHKYFLHEAKKYCDELVCVLATDYNIKKLKQQTPHFSEEERKTHIEELQIANFVYIGDKQNPMKWIEYYQPHIICLGYDQVGFSKQLAGFPNIKNMRIGAFKEEIYKSSKLKKKEV